MFNQLLYFTDTILKPFPFNTNLDKQVIEAVSKYNQVFLTTCSRTADETPGKNDASLFILSQLSLNH